MAYSPPESTQTTGLCVGPHALPAGGLRPLRAGPAVGGVRPRRQAAWASSMAAVAFIARRSLPAGWTVMTKPRHETEKPGNPHDDTG